MAWGTFHNIVVSIQSLISFAGILIILSGVIIAVCQYLYYIFTWQLVSSNADVNGIRLKLGRILILGLEFIVASDLISTTTAPDYYSVGIVAIIVVIRTVLSFSLNKEIMSLQEETAIKPTVMPA
jgi:uncharacterized membrane protein